ncbi:hypothetical protein MBT84_39650 [Streptomyces sp. MBT84]|uniref:hypothetical protein n=1 Tax=unclassified Streptomyces TaxID=2593676 RepID=UPI001C6E15B8|nr:hypothetical protein [Streptomyces sp. MBT84]MBW8705742.1 hypothetical protein [Streptomyces sp. MBT84]
MTASRRSGPRRWLRAVEWLLAAGLHPRAGATTLRVARDLAARMDYDTGHVIYGLQVMMTTLRLSRPIVARHVAYLRELGALVWVEHGCRANVHRAQGLPGYAGTATVYAAAIPRIYDEAMGYRIVGSGYLSRIIVDLRATRSAPDSSRRATITTAPRRGPVDKSAVDNCSSRGL